MNYVIQTRYDAEVPEVDNIVPNNFTERELISNSSLSSVSEIIIGSNTSNLELSIQISSDLKKAIEDKTQKTVKLETDITIKEPTNNSIIVGNIETNNLIGSLFSPKLFNFPSSWDSESYIVKGIHNDTTDMRHLMIYTNDSLGETYAIYWLIDQIQYGEEFSGDLFVINKIKGPDVKLRMLDTNSAFLDPTSRFKKSPTEQLDLAKYPYFNISRIESAKEEFREFLNYTLRTGYNTLQIEEFSHFVTYDDVSNGKIVANYSILSKENPFRIRHQLYQKYYSEFFEQAEKLGISTYIYTRIPYLAEPVINYFEGLEPKKADKIINLYVKAIDEFFTRFPSVDGLQVMTGEVGGSHNVLDYYGATVFTTEDILTKVIQKILEILKKHNKKMIYRIWSIGIGELGDLHRNPQQYDRLFEQFKDKDNLIVSIKFQAGDYFRYLEFNPNIGRGKLPQMVEVSGTLEYSGMSLYPCYLAELFQEFMQNLDNPPYAMWSWVTAGAAPKESGYVGPFVIFLKRGFWSNIDVNINGYGKIGWNINCEINEITRTWVMKKFGNEHKSIVNITKMLLMSDEMDYLGTYVADYAKLQPSFLGDLPYPISWISWDTIQSSAFALAPIYEACKNDRGIEANVDDGFLAANIALEMTSILSELKINGNRSLFNLWETAAEYGYKLFKMLAYYRETFLYYYDYCETLAKESKQRYKVACNQLIIAKNAYINTFSEGRKGMFPLWDLSQLDRFIHDVRNYEKYKRIALCCFVFLLIILLGSVFLSRKRKKTKDNNAKNMNERKSKILDGNLYAFFVASSALFREMIFKPCNKLKTTKNEKNKHMRNFTYIVTIFIFLFESLKLTIFNLGNFGLVLFLFRLFQHIFSWLLISLLSFCVVKFLKTKKFKIGFHHILKGVAVALSIPSFLSSFVYFGIFSIWGPQIVWLMWVNSYILVFVTYFLVISRVMTLIILVVVLKTSSELSTKQSLVIVFTNYSLISLVVIFPLWLKGFQLWDDLVYLGHNSFNLFFSTMFERGPGASAWINLTLTEIFLTMMSLSLILLIMTAIVYFRNRRLENE